MSTAMEAAAASKDGDAMVESSPPTVTPPSMSGAGASTGIASSLLPTPPPTVADVPAAHPSAAFLRARTPPTARTSEDADDEGAGGAVAGSSRSPATLQRRLQPSGSGSSAKSCAAVAVSSAVAGTSHASSTEEDRRGRSNSRQQRKEPAEGSPRSRTPSPILGSSSGHLSFAPALEPTAEEVHILIYGEDGKDEERPADVTKAEVEGLESRLKSMGLGDAASGTATSERERELAAMAKKILHHSQLQDHYIDSLEASLHNTRLRSISTLSSMRTTFAHSFAAEYEMRSRLEAELEDTRAQARKLSSMLAKSENRKEEAERERAMSAEAEVMWQEEMKDHAGAYAQQQAARARAAQLNQKQLPASSSENAALRTPGKGAATGLDTPFEERSSELGGLPKSSSDSNVLGLGISSPSQPGPEAGASSSPLSTIIKERNKLLADKRYLKARARDAEAQRDRLEIELKSLRPLLVRGAPSKKEASSVLATPSAGNPTTPSRSQKRDRSRRRRQAVMGDAEAEHLLLAARRINSRPPKEDPRPHTPPSVPSTVPMRTPKTPRTAQTPRVPGTMETVTQGSASTRAPDTDVFPSTNASPLAARGNGPGPRWGSHQRVDSNRSVGGIDDLLHAAQTVLTPGERQRQSAQRTRTNVMDSDQEEDLGRVSPPRGGPSSVSRFTTAAPDGSPKRRRVSGTSFSPPRRASNGLPLSPDKSLFNSARRLRTSTEGAEPYSSQESFQPSGPVASQASALSALDLLADQATQSQQPSQSSDFSGSGEGEPPHVGPGSEHETDDGMHVDHEMAPMHGPMPPNGGGHFYPRGSYGHPYAHPPPINAPPMVNDGYRMMPGPQGAPYGFAGPTGSPVSLSSQGWTSSNIPAPRNGLYSPPAGQPRFALQGGPRISTGHVAPMGGPVPGPHPFAAGPPGMAGEREDGSVGSEEGSDGEGDDGTGRTPQKGGNTSPDKRLPYVRWSEEEDAKLRRAIDEFGQRWELVARAVESRSYHQCRQRYLLMRRKDAAAREGMALSAAHSSGSANGTGRSHTSSRPAAVSSPVS